MCNKWHMPFDYNFRCDKILPLSYEWENHVNPYAASPSIKKYGSTYYHHPRIIIRPLNCRGDWKFLVFYHELTWIFIKFSFDCNGGNWQRMLWKENSRLCTCSYCCRTKSMSPLGMSLNNVLRTIHVIRKMVQMKKRWNVCGSK